MENTEIILDEKTGEPVEEKVFTKDDVVADEIRSKHWHIDGVMLAGVTTQQEAFDLYTEANNPNRVEVINITVGMVRAEASRRMQLLVGARDEKHLNNIISNGNREAIRLLNIGSDNWTVEQLARKKQLENIDKVFEDIRKSSNVLELSKPDNYADGKHWPIVTS